MMKRLTWLVGMLVCGAVGPGYAQTAPAVSITPDPATTMPASPGYHVLSMTVRAGGRTFPMSYAIFLPASYFQAKESFPLVVSLHNMGSRGQRGENLTAELLNRLMVEGKWSPGFPGKRPQNPVDVQKSAQFVGLMPQLPRDQLWEAPPIPQVVDQLIAHVIQTYRLDADRVYLVGASYGGTSTWQLALALPQRFAAIAPTSARAVADPRAAARALKNVAVWIACGDNDPGFLPLVKSMHAAFVQEKHPNVRLQLIEGGDHFAYFMVFTDPAFWDFLLAQRRARATTQPAPAPG